MIKNIMGATIAVALAVSIGTTGVRSIVADTSLLNRSNINETFKLSSKNGADLNIYVLDRTYDYQL